MKNYLIILLRLSLPFLLFTISTSVSAFKQGDLKSLPNHQKITESALLLNRPPMLLANGSQIQFSGWALIQVKDANASVDGWSHILDPEYHFDNNDYIASSKVLSDARLAIVSSIKIGEYEDARKKLGQALHTVQDFYAHSNWVEKKLADPSLPYPELGKPNPFADPKLVFELNKACNLGGVEGSSAITTGYWDNQMGPYLPILNPDGKNLDLGWSTSFWKLIQPYWPEDRCVHGADAGSGLNKDQQLRPNYSKAFAFAALGSGMFLDEVLATLRASGGSSDQAICGLLGQLSSPACQTPLNIPATSFLRGTNVALSVNGYGADTLMNQPPYGEVPNAAEWDINVPATGTYELFAEYAAAVSRPVTISFNGSVAFTNSMGTVTGGWFPAHRQSISQGVLQLTAGPNVLRVARTSVFAHIKGFKLVQVD